MPRRRACLHAVLIVASLGAAAHARAQQAEDGDRLRRLDPSALAGGEGGLAGGDYGSATSDPAPLAGGDYGVVADPARQGADAAGPAAATILADPLATAPRGFRRLRTRAPLIDPDDPYAPLGIKAGTFLLRPTIDTAGGYDDNPDRIPGGGRGSKFVRLRGELEAQSDWTRHAAGFRGSAQIRKYGDIPQSGLEPEVNGALTGRLDITERAQLNAEVRAALAASRPGDPETPDGIDGDEITRNVGATVGVAHRFNRLSLRLDGLVDRYTVDDAKLRTGARLDNSDRAYNAYQARLRGSYELSPKLEPFIEAAVDTRRYDQSFSNTEIDRRLGSDGYALRTGARFEMTRLITGEAALGYGRQTPKDKDLKPVEGLLIDGAVAWAPTGLTTVRLGARSGLQETTLEGAGGVLSRAFTASVEHRLRRNLTVTGRVAFERADYRGAGQIDDSVTIGLDAEYRLTRNLALTASLERVKLDSSIPGEDYTASIIEFGLRFRR